MPGFTGADVQSMLAKPAPKGKKGRKGRKAAAPKLKALKQRITISTKDYGRL